MSDAARHTFDDPSDVVYTFHIAGGRAITVRACDVSWTTDRRADGPEQLVYEVRDPTARRRGRKRALRLWPEHVLHVEVEVRP